MWETWVWSLGQEDPLEKEMATHSSTLAWKIPKERGGLQSTGSQRVGHDWVISLYRVFRGKDEVLRYLDLKKKKKNYNQKLFLKEELAD